MNNKQNEANGYKCVLCETGEGKRHGLGCSLNEDNPHLTEEYKRLLKILIRSELKKLGDNHPDISKQYSNILQKL